MHQKNVEKTIIKKENRFPKPLKLCVSMVPFADKTVAIFSLQLLTVLEQMADSIYYIGSSISQEWSCSKKVNVRDLRIVLHFKNSIKPTWFSILLWLFKNIAIQLRTTFEICRIANRVNIIFFFGVPYCLLPLLSAKLMKNKTVIFAWGRMPLIGNHIVGSRATITIIRILENIHFLLADRVCVETKGATRFLKLSKYRNKIFYLAKYIDLDLFKIEKELRQRESLVGYIGRLDKSKGVMNIIESIPLVSQRREDINFLIIGEGSLRDEVEEKIRNFQCKVNFLGWVSHKEVPRYLNELKLLLLPSYSEGLSTILLEAMACGTLVLATDVGGASDIIEHEDTGFILRENSPQSIAENVISILQRQDLEEIVSRARAIVEQKFSYDVVTKRYETVFQGICGDFKANH